MTRQKYEKICQASFGGEVHVVENRALHEQGTVFSCKSDTFNVRVGNDWRQWGWQVCEEVGEGRRQA